MGVYFIPREYKPKGQFYFLFGFEQYNNYLFELAKVMDVNLQSFEGYGGIKTFEKWNNGPLKILFMTMTTTEPHTLNSLKDYQCEDMLSDLKKYTSMLVKNKDIGNKMLKIIQYCFENKIACDIR